MLSGPRLEVPTSHTNAPPQYRQRKGPTRNAARVSIWITIMTENLERAVLAGGCFWGMQDLIRKLPGVKHTRVGYTGGDVKFATYRKHGTHAEGIEIWFDSEKISYRQLLE